ncbi:MAG: chloride channel protein [Chloroflexi bacterium]|nr:chloride channel protein [Chloroflexota bacterium]
MNHKIKDRLDIYSYLQTLLKLLHRAHVPIDALLAIVVGIAAGLGAVGFRYLLEIVTDLFFVGGQDLLGSMGKWYVVLIPAAGGLLVGPLVYRFAREAQGHGVPEVMAAVVARGGRIRPRVAIVKTLASSICIGSGGSVGREGPIVQIGSAIGSTIGQVLRLSPGDIRLLVACGAAGGISGTFNAPLAGVLFSMEIILHRYTGRSFGLVALSSVTSAAIAHAFFGDSAVFLIPSYELASSWEFPLYILLGVIAAFVAYLFVAVLYKSENLFEALKFPPYLKPVIGGLAVGLIGVFYPQVFGVGYGTVDFILAGHLALSLLLPLLLIKILATSLTLGSGGSGGVFAPSLFIGAVLGGAFGNIGNELLPGITGPEGAYALVGMAAVFAAAARAPATSIVILFEMTRDYDIILPLIAAVVVSTIVARILRRESIYTIKMQQQGVSVPDDEQWDALRDIQVGDAMTTEYPTIDYDASLADLNALFIETGHHGFPVLDEHQNLVGIVTVSDLRSIKPGSGQTVKDIATFDLVVAFPDQSLHDALAQFWGRDVGHIPVVDRDDRSKLLGVVRRHNIVQAYADSTQMGTASAPSGAG